MDEKRDLYSQSIGVRHEAKDGKNNKARKQRRDLIIKTHLLERAMRIKFNNHQKTYHKCELSPVTELERAMRIASLWQFRSNLQNIKICCWKKHCKSANLLSHNNIKLSFWSLFVVFFVLLTFYLFIFLSCCMARVKGRPVIGGEGDYTATSWPKGEDHLITSFWATNIMICSGDDLLIYETIQSIHILFGVFS